MYSRFRSKTKHNFGAKIMDIEKNTHIIVVNSKDNQNLNAAIAANLAIELAEGKLNVATVDLDGEDGFLSKFFLMRKQYEEKQKIWLKMTTHKTFSHDNEQNLSQFIKDAENKFDVIIIPSPSEKNNFKSEFFAANTLVTILEEKTSLALLSEPEPSKTNILKPSAYTDFVWEVKKHLASTQKKSLNWAVLPYQTAETSEKQRRFLQEISKKYGFRISPAILPRNIVADLFEQGLTLFDLNNSALKKMMTLEWLGAKRDYRNFAEFVLNF